MTTVTEKIEHCMNLAKGMLVKDGSLAPVAIFIKNDEWVPLLLKFGTQEEKEKYHDMVQWGILTLRPDCVIVISESWLKELQGADAKKGIEGYVPGSIANDPHRVEVISVVGGSVDGIEGMIQKFHRKGKKQEIVFDEVLGGSIGYESAFFGDAWSILAAEEKGTSN